MFTINDLKFSNRKFWTGFFATSFPTALDEETDIKATGIISDALKNIFDDQFCGKLQKDMVAAMICGCACDKE